VGGRTGGYRSEEIVVIAEDGFTPITDYPYSPMATEVSPDTALCGPAPGAGAAQMDAHNLDILVLGRQANIRYVTGAPQLWIAGTRPFGPMCVLVRATGDIYLNSTDDEGVPKK